MLSLSWRQIFEKRAQFRDSFALKASVSVSDVDRLPGWSRAASKLFIISKRARVHFLSPFCCLLCRHRNDRQRPRTIWTVAWRSSVLPPSRISGYGHCD